MIPAEHPENQSDSVEIPSVSQSVSHRVRDISNCRDACWVIKFLRNRWTVQSKVVNLQQERLWGASLTTKNEGEIRRQMERREESARGKREWKEWGVTLCVCVCLGGCWSGEVSSCQDAGVKFIFPARGDADRMWGQDEGMDGGEEGKEWMRARMSSRQRRNVERFMVLLWFHPQLLFLKPCDMRSE